MKEEGTIITKFGNARIYNGYYEITSYKEGNKGKKLHRLIWEDHYGKPVPKGYDIHHINLDKQDNRIQNLQCVKHDLHMKFHAQNRSDETKRKMSESKMGEKNPIYRKTPWNKGKPHSEETIRKMCEVRNTTGYYRVFKEKCKKCKQGFTWIYIYPDENGKQKRISSVNINKLEEKVKAKGLDWIILDKDKGVK